MTVPKKPMNLYKLAKMTTFYILIVGIMMVILTPIFFIVSLSFLSTREAYEYPLPLLPSLRVKYELTYGKRGYLLSVYDRVEKAYEPVLDTQDLEKMSVYMKAQLGAPLTVPEITVRIAQLG